MSFNRSLLTQITKDLADKKKPAKPKAGNQQKFGDTNPYYIDKSNIAGKGAFAKQFIPKGSMVDMLHQINHPGVDYDFTQLGRSYNHSEDPNTVNQLVGNKRYMVANEDIYPGQELTGDYRMQPDLEQPQDGWQMKNGGQMIKRADGSYSKRGLWDNIRANKGSGKKPSKQMLEQERKIRAKMQEGGIAYADTTRVGNVPRYVNPGNYRGPQDFSGLIRAADIATDVMQLGHFIPHPVPQGIALAGDFFGAGIDSYQAADALTQGNYGDASINAASAFLPSYLKSRGYLRDMHNANPGSLAARIAKFGSKAGNYRPLTALPRLVNNPVVNKGIRANRSVAGALTAETAYDQHQNGGQTYSQMAQDARNFVNTWNNSPMAQQMLANSVDRDDPYGLNSTHTEAMSDARNTLTDQAKVQVVRPIDIINRYKVLDPKTNASGIAGYATAGRASETLGSILGAFRNPSNYMNGMDKDYYKYINALSYNIAPGQIVAHNDSDKHNIDESLVHEFAHASDWGGYFMPNSDIEKIQRYSKAGAKDNFTKYVAEPTETRARLINLRYNAKNQGIYDPFTQKINQQQLNKYQTSSHPGYDPLEQLRKVYNDKQITDMLNTISYNDQQKDPDAMQAKHGGEVTDNVKEFMDVFNMKYGGTPYTHLQDGGEPQSDPEYTGSSVVDYLATKGFEGSKQFRKELAKDMNIEGYDFSAKKNLELLAALRKAESLPIGYEESFDPIDPAKMMALEQQRGTYVPMPGVIPVSQQQYDSRQTPAPVQEEVVNQQPVVVKRPAPAKPIVSHPLANNSILRYPGPAAPVNPYAGMYNPRVPLNSVPAGKAVPVASKPQFFDPRIPQNTVPVQQNRPVVAPTNVVAPVSAGNSFNIPMAGQQQFPGMYNQQAALASIKTALAPKRTAAAAVKNKVTPAVIKPEIVKLNNVDETNEENGKAWYENIADTFSNAVKNAPYDFSKIGLGSTGPNPHFDREALQHMIVNAAKLVSPEKGVLADNYFKRQALKNNDNLQETKTKFEVPKVGKSAIVTGDTISIDKDRYVIPAMIDLNQTKWGVRNRDEYKDINTEAGDITTFQSFENAKDYFKKNLNDPYNSTYVGVDAKGNVKVGNRIDFSGTDYRISKTFGNKIVDFVDEPNGSMKLKPTSAKASNRHLSPVVKVIGDDGVTKEGSMNLLIPKKSKDTHSFGQITGGRVIFKTPKGEQYLVSGSAEDIKKAFKQIKGNNPYVEAVTLDNGSYAMGLRNKNQKITADQLRAYQGSNSTGSAFLYLQPGNYTRQSSVAPPAAAAPKFQFKDVQMKTPNIRTEKDESFKKGHPLKNEQKAIILHHTGYSDASGIDKGMSAAMKGVNQQFSKPGESSHIVIDFDGTRYNYARPDQVTFHAGKSLLNGRDNVNDFGIGIEFQGDTDRKHLTDKQINSFVEYIAPIIKKNKIPLSSVVTHKMIRKDYMKSNPQDKDVYSKPDLNEYDYKRILKALKDKKVYKFGGSTTSNWLENYN